MNASRILLSTLECPTLPPLPPVFLSEQQSVACDGDDLIDVGGSLPDGVSVSGASLILDAGHSSADTQENSNALALAYLNTVYNDGIASGDLVCLGGPELTDLCGWWKADSFALADGTPVGGPGNEWIDQTAGNKDATQSNAAAQPLFKTNVSGNRPAIRMDGIDDTLVFTPDFTFTGPGSHTVLFVYKHNVALTDGMLFGFQGLPFQILSRASVSQMRAYDLNILYDSSPIVPPETDIRMVAFRNRLGSANQMFRVNKTNVGPLTQSNIGFRWDTIGSTVGALFLNGDFFEILVYCAELSDAQIDAIYDNYLRLRYPALPAA